MFYKIDYNIYIMEENVDEAQQKVTESDETLYTLVEEDVLTSQTH